MASLFTCLILTSCSVGTEQACSSGQVLPTVFVDSSELEFEDLDGVLVCLDRLCEQLGDTTVNGGRDEGGSMTVLAVIGDQPRRKLSIEADGEVLAGPWDIQIPVVDAGCPGAGLQGRFSIAEGGRIELTSTADS